MTNLEQLVERLKIKRKIAIIGHRNPDGDAIGSTLGLYHFLKRRGHEVITIVPSEYPYNFSWMDGIEEMMIYDIQPNEVNVALDNCEFVACLDFNSFQRIDKLGDYVAALDVELIMIDHHLYPDLPVDYMISDTEASSTCELVFRFIDELNALGEIDPVIAECLYTGLITDTGCFRYNVSEKTFRTAGKLISMGVDDAKLQDFIYNSQSEKHLRLLGHCLVNRLEILPEYNAGIIYLNREDYDFYNIQRGDTEGIVNYILTLKGIKMAVFVSQQPSITKLSFRSKGDFSVQEIASKYFNGGGHLNAAGGYTYGPLHNTINKIKSILPEYKEKLNA